MKRITVFSGHYGSGKTNVALSVALGLARSGQSVTVADLDIVNPYFRTKDSARELEKAGIELICSDYANTNVDIPALPQSMYAITDDRSRKVVVDLGGDDRGALALGRLAPAILEENDFDLFAVINMFRPLTKTAEETVGVMKEIEAASGLRFTGLVNNSNLGEETTPETVLSSLPYAEETARLTGLPIVMTTVEKELYPLLKEKIPNLEEITLQPKIW
ncbi:MAG: hypothetical protein SOZ93_03260 [Eubacteriales bacterium]|nr:hypothetical protein [Clostridiales bacterium]MDY3760328.1 hypothetical protein [Eubacteriales bacterium]